MFRMGWFGMAEVEECLFDVAHRQEKSAVSRVSLDQESAISDCLPIFAYLVVCFESIQKVSCILAVGVFDDKVIDNKWKGNGTDFVLPEAGCDGAWGLAVRLKEAL